MVDMLFIRLPRIPDIRISHIVTIISMPFTYLIFSDQLRPRYLHRGLSHQDGWSLYRGHRRLRRVGRETTKANQVITQFVTLQSINGTVIPRKPISRAFWTFGRFMHNRVVHENDIALDRQSTSPWMPVWRSFRDHSEGFTRPTDNETDNLGFVGLLTTFQRIQRINSPRDRHWAITVYEYFCVICLLVCLFSVSWAFGLKDDWSRCNIDLINIAC